MSDEVPTHDRDLLLLGAERNAVLELREVQRYGRESCGDPDYVSIYGMRPAEWYATGVRVLGRTAVECTRDGSADVIGKDVAAIATTSPQTVPTLVVDPFAGSGNTLYWLLRHLPGARGVGLESDVRVFRLTRQNLAALALPIEVVNDDYVSGLAALPVAPDELVIAFLAPPWGGCAGQDSRPRSPAHHAAGRRGRRCRHPSLLAEPRAVRDLDPRDCAGGLRRRAEVARRLVGRADRRPGCARPEPRRSSRDQALDAARRPSLRSGSARRVRAFAAGRASEPRIRRPRPGSPRQARRGGNPGLAGRGLRLRSRSLPRCGRCWPRRGARRDGTARCPSASRRADAR